MACKKLLPLPQIVADAGNGAQALMHANRYLIDVHAFFDLVAHRQQRLNMEAVNNKELA